MIVFDLFQNRARANALKQRPKILPERECGRGPPQAFRGKQIGENDARALNYWPPGIQYEFLGHVPGRRGEGEAEPIARSRLRLPADETVAHVRNRSTHRSCVCVHVSTRFASRFVGRNAIGACN